ncbi:MAG: choice-of-anchor L domain-containing protein [Limisphaerales bacterium]
MQYNGFTPLLSCQTTLSAGWHHVKIAIADSGDQSYDSAVFIERCLASAPG